MACNIGIKESHVPETFLRGSTRPFSKRFWTLSAWEGEAALQAFVEHPPYVRVMAALTPHMNKTKFVRWMVKGSQLPLQWDDALRRFSSSPLWRRRIMRCVP